MRLLNFDLANLDAGAIAVEDLLHELLDGSLDRLTSRGQNIAHLALADHLTHGAFSDIFHCLIGILDIEEIVIGPIDEPLHDEIYVDDILIRRQHQALLWNVQSTAGPAHAPVARVALRAIAHLDLIRCRDFEEPDFLNRIRETELKARFGPLVEGTEAHDDALLVRPYLEEEGVPCNEQERHHGAEEHKPARNAAAPSHDLLHAVLAAPEHLLEIRGLTTSATAPTLTPWTSASPATPAFPSAITTALIAPGHGFEASSY